MRFFVSCLRLTVHSFAYLNFGGVRYLVLTFDLTFLIFDCNSQEGIHFSLLFKGSAIYIWKQNYQIRLLMCSIVVGILVGWGISIVGIAVATSSEEIGWGRERALWE